MVRMVQNPANFYFCTSRSLPFHNPESGNGQNFLGGLEISSLAALNAQARRWMERVANVRFHRETGKRPCDLFEQEKPTLQPLPLAGYDISCNRRVRAINRCRIAFESNGYTVLSNTPAHCWNCVSNTTLSSFTEAKNSSPSILAATDATRILKIPITYLLARRA